MSGLVLLSGLIAAVVLCRRVIVREREELRATTEAQARRIASQIQIGVVGSVEPLKRLGQWWLTQGKPSEREDWATDGQLFLSQSPGLLKALWIDPGGRQQWSAAPGATPDLTSRVPETEVLRETATAQQSGLMAVSEVFRNAQGEALVYICFPVEQGARIRGSVVGLYDAGVLTSAIAKNSILPDQQIAILADGRQVYPAARAAPAAEPAAASISLANRTWLLKLNVPLNYFREFRGLILSVIALIGALIYSFALLLAISQRWSSSLQRLNSELTSEVQLRARAEEEVRGLNTELTHRVADFETLLEVIPIGIVVADSPDLRGLRINPAFARMLGASEESGVAKGRLDLAGLAYRPLGSGRDPRLSELPLAVAFRTANTVAGEEGQIVRADGTALDVLSFAAPLFDENRVVRRVIYACVDVSERKRLEQQMQKVDRMRRLGGMASGIAHDFNNLLTGMIGHASLAAECLPQDADAFQHISACIKATERASSLVHKVLTYTGNSPHRLRPGNPAETVKQSEPWLRMLLPPDANLHFDIAPGVPDVLLDVDELRQALKNLISNAVEATASKASAIEIRVRECEVSEEDRQLMLPDAGLRPGTYVRVEVRDHGEGMAPEVAERAFDPFFSTKFLGRGLGLSEVLGIMRAHRGAVRLSPEPAGGTSVQLFFPPYQT